MEVGFWRIVWYWSGGRFMKILFDVLSLIYEIIMVFFFLFSRLSYSMLPQSHHAWTINSDLLIKQGVWITQLSLGRSLESPTSKLCLIKLVEHLVFFIWTVDKTKLPWQLMHVVGFSLIANLLIKMAQNGFPVFKHQFLDWLVDTTTTLFFHLTMLSKKCPVILQNV